MTTKDLDLIYKQIKFYCMTIMQTKCISASIMDFVLSKVLSDIQVLHLTEIIEEDNQNEEGDS